MRSFRISSFSLLRYKVESNRRWCCISMVSIEVHRTIISVKTQTDQCRNEELFHIVYQCCIASFNNSKGHSVFAEFVANLCNGECMQYTWTDCHMLLYSCNKQYCNKLFELFDKKYIEYIHTSWIEFFCIKMFYMILEILFTSHVRSIHKK